MNRLARRLAMLSACLATTAAAPPPPPAPPPAAMDREVQGHNLARVFGDYRMHVAEMVAQRMERQGQRLFGEAAQLGAPRRRENVLASPRGIGFTVSGTNVGADNVRAGVVEYCPEAFVVDRCTWVFTQLVHRNGLVQASNFDGEQAAARLRAAGIPVPPTGERYPATIVEAISEDANALILSAFSSSQLTSTECPALDAFAGVFAAVPAAVQSSLADPSTSTDRMVVEHGPWLTVTFNGAKLAVTATSGVDQPAIVGDSYAVIQRARRECALPDWPSTY